jgi:ligand-binding SRPBCC domain-containing protein
MAKIFLRTEIIAPIERCFDLSRSIDLHQQSTARTHEKAIAGKTEGLISLGESVTWRAKHFGIWQELTSKITVFHYPHHFTDEMTKGIFKYIYHCHEFAWTGQKTVMTDVFEFQSPAGFLGKIADTLFLKSYLTKFLLERNQMIKDFAESDQWKTILVQQPNT